MKIVFVHLGPGPAPHLWRNIRRFCDLFPTQQPTVILSDIRHKKYIDSNKIGLHLYQTSSETESQLSKLSSNVKFRSGFWRYSIERFYAIRDFHKLDPATPILHFESDVLPLPNFPFEKFLSIKNLAWENFSASHDVSAILYSNSYEDSKWLVEEINHELSGNADLTDMTALSEISGSNCERVEILPTNPISSEPNRFGGIFDAAAIGMWLNGRDPRNHLGFVKRFLPLPESSVDASKHRYKSTLNGTLFLINDKEAGLTIFNLHVHSKRRGLMGKHWSSVLFFDVITSRIGIMKTWFSPISFAFILKDYIARNGINLQNFAKTLRILTRDKNAN